MQASVDLIKAGDFNGLWKHALPPADYANLRADWSRHQQDPRPITAEDRAKFNETMQQLTGPDAENKLYAELQPKLAAMEQQYKDQLPVLISVGEALAKKRRRAKQGPSPDRRRPRPTSAGRARTLGAANAMVRPGQGQAGDRRGGGHRAQARI